MIGLYRQRLIAIGAVATIVAGCAHEPAFRVELPREVEREGRALAIIGDLQQTPGFVRLVRQREETSAEQRQLVNDLATHIGDLSALIIVGDLVYTARSRRDWNHLDRLLAPFSSAIPVLPAIGNHDYPCFLVQFCSQSAISDGMLERFPWFVPGQPYAVDSGNLILIFLDSETGLEAQGRWLETRLTEAAPDFAAALIFFHRPPFSDSTDRGAEGDVDVEAHIVPRLENAALPVVVFNGHIHGFEYIVRNGVHYITSAGGGGPRGPMSDLQPLNAYRGRDCPQPNGSLFRPFNYALLRDDGRRISIDIHGFCRGDDSVEILDSIQIDL